ncbi:MAG: glyceraldehyde-3-phosphate dehydrogenase [Bacteroidales bacterium]|nr:glyceraldehyde-3-phosphate dehydrogenase [Bacteroidales bacterium]MCF8345027.1 glyceraldehyde-3-phosphate dehydrogenase [Bacteroidales bacterium]MCF8351700.1 glyceraldehyde-3-phosphate dehydrogenase [Bacteroidales bacterium]MCF8375366.1 glyceraldehyde-3-phosphate dehydrogenase [Bacteroidales bacterium]MCF8400222.1 glyceraldehyde-3-phosphate dehydrogenase [Bacteroidales bacterium]
MSNDSSGANTDNGNYESSLQKWFTDEKVANDFISVMTRLFYDKSVELILFRSQLIDRSASVVLYKHSYAERTIGKVLDIRDSMELANAIYECNVGPSRLDIGKLNYEWTNSKNDYADAKEFIKDKLRDFIDRKPPFEKPADVIIFGFGRIGRLIARELIIQGNGSQLRVRAIVARKNKGEDIRKRASLFRHDSIHGPFRGIAVEDVDEETIFANGHYIKMIEASAPEDVDYTQYGISDALVIDSTGVWRDRQGLERHLKAKGVKKVLLTAPGKGDIPNIVYGINHNEADPDTESVFSAASCTTNAIVPALSVIEKELGIESGHVETIHAYTNDQNLLDNYHKKYRRGRSAPINMVITETGAAKAAVKIIPSLEGKLSANAVRVPVPNVSLAILSLRVKKDISLEELDGIMREAAIHGRLVEQIRYSSAYEAVSTDFIGDPVACIYDSPATKVVGDRNIVLYLWYDNEFGYTIQVMRLAKHIAGVKRFRYY